MNRLRKVIVTAALLGTLLAPGAAHAATQPKDPDCTWTNDNIAVCKYANGTKVCYDHYGQRIPCPKAAELGLAGH